VRAVVALGNRLAQAPKCRATRQARAHSSAALQLGGLQGLAQWLQGRLQLPRLSPVERVELLALAKTLGRMATPLRKELREQAQLQAQAQQQQPPAPSWAERRAALIQREQQRRTGPAPSYALALARPTTTATPRSAMASTSSDSTHSRQARGEMGVRLERKLDRLLAEVLAAEPEAGVADQSEPMAQPPAAESAPASSPAAPITTNLAHQTELPALAEEAAADLHQQVLVAAAHGLLESELEPQPLPVSIHALALEAAWAAEPPAVAELSPRARAIAELGAALLRGDQNITLPAASAAELLEALAG